MKLTAIILTFNESVHIERCIRSLRRITPHILVVDSFSTDDTVDLAHANGARVLQHKFVNHAAQLNWAISQVESDTDWIFRIDADEYLDDELTKELPLALARTSVSGFYVKRRLIFQDRDIRFGMVYPVHILRVFRNGLGHCVERWMDEHIQVEGDTSLLHGTLYDHSLRSLTWWIAKHNRYASLEAVEQLDAKYHFLRPSGDVMPREKLSFSFKRWAKRHVYGRLPAGARAMAYFIFRYVLALGFLDGRAGMAFHFLQGFWYRYLVDAKVSEVERHMRQQQCDARIAVEHILDVRLQ